MAERRLSAVDNEARLPSSPRASATTTTGHQRITRSTARQVAQASRPSGVPAAAATSHSNASSAIDTAEPPTTTAPTTRKRKAAAVPSESKSPGAATAASESTTTTRQSKRQKIPTSASPPRIEPQVHSRPKRKAKASSAMDTSDGSSGPSNPPPATAGSASSSRKSSRSKKSTQSAQDALGGADSSSSSSTRKSKRVANTSDGDTAMTGTDEVPDRVPSFQRDHSDDKDEETDEDEQVHDHRRFDEDDDSEDDPFGAFGGPGGSALSGTLRALTGMMTGFTARLREILNNIRQDDLSLQLIALQDLSEILLVSNEDNLSGHFSPDAFVKELVALMNKETSPEIMLLACRCLANLMEALPASVANVVYGNAVPVLCQKLLEISFIDLAEQALSTLEKISVEYPASIVREGGLTACLSFLDFFPTSTQRTAVTTAANCCRNIPNDSFPVVRDVMPTLLTVLNSNDQRVVEQASLCVSGIVESFKYYPHKLEELISVDLLRAVLRLLLPGSTNLVGPNIHTQFLRVLAITARASPRLSAELFKLNVVETLYQILTGVSPPSGTEDVASKLDSVVIMQALIHRPREQIVETLNVICELLPSLPHNADPVFGDFVEYNGVADLATASAADTRPRRNESNEKRVALLEECKEHVRRFALILFPTLTDAFSSTVNLGVRQKVLTAQLKMLSNLDKDILTEALVPVPYASFLASILSQQDHPTLVMLALQASEFLISRLDHIYRYQFYREGVITEITSLASRADKQQADDKKDADADAVPQPDANTENTQPTGRASTYDEDDDGERETSEDDDELDDEGEGEEDDEDDDEENEPEHHADDVSPVSSRGSTMSIDAPVHRDPSDVRTIQARIQHVAKKILETHENEEHTRAMKEKADVILGNLSHVASELEAFYLKRDCANLSPIRGKEIFTKLASYFDTNVLESVTSAELLASGLVRVLLDVFSNPDEQLTHAAQSTFLEVFMGYMVQSRPKTATADSPVTPFSVMVHKLQDLLSRSEHFEVITVHQNSFDGNRGSAASMLGKQIRLRLVADDDSDIPKPYRNIMVSIHAIATFKSLDEYLRPRLVLSDRPRGSRRDGLSRALAAMAGAGALPLSAAAAQRLADRPQFGAQFGAGALPPPPPPPAAPTPVGSRSSRKAKSRVPATPQGDSTPSPNPFAGPSGERTVLRRSSRRQAVAEETPPARPPPDDEENQSTLECADEKQLSDDDDAGDSSALDAIVGELQDEIGEESPSEPSAVSMEVAAGGNVTARKEDGTRVPTPGGSGLASRPGPPPAPPSQSTPTPSSASRALSYSGALLATPQDWHIEFSLDDKIVPNETTIYRAVHASATSDEPVQRSIWSATHSVKFRRVQGPPPIDPNPVGLITETEIENGIPASLAKNPTTTSILSLLNILHQLNANIEDVLVGQDYSVAGLHREPLSQFVNTKLTAKLNRQLEEPLIVASNCLPSWAEDLARLYPFLFPFETRHLFLQSTSFGYARSMARWQSTQTFEDNRRDRHNERPFLGRLQRQKVRISRSKILESALKVMDLYGTSQSMLEVEYFEEVGTGLGPTLEFYSIVSLEFSKKKLKLWRDMDSSADSEYVTSQSGLFPRPISAQEASTPNGERILHLFRMLGKFIARSMIDSRIIDLHFNPTFFRTGESAASGIKPSLGAVKTVDPGLARSLMTIKKFEMAKKEINEDPNRTAAQKVADVDNIVIDGMKLEDLCLDFTLPGYPEIELEEGGAHKRVTIDNVESYLEKVIDATLGSGVRRQVDAFRSGFSSVFPYSALSAFTPEELVNLFGRVEEDWSLETLIDSMKADHGFNMDSASVQNLLHLMSEFNATQRRDFLQFSTGSPKLPIGGFKNLTPMFTVVCKPSEDPYTSDDYLPSVMTCVNYLKLPAYSSREVMKRQLSKAMKEGQGAFHLS